MRIATYNIWNSDAGMPARFAQLTDAITQAKADVLCLQEVSDLRQSGAIADACGYGYAHFQAQTGLSILSRYPLEAPFDLAWGAAAHIRFLDRTLLVINVHLPWEKASLREKAIVDIIEGTADVKADHTFLAGDFNASENASVHRFLMGEQSLLGADACYFDLAAAAAEARGAAAAPTLCFYENPRWGVAGPKNTLEVSQRFDRILLKNPYPHPAPVLKQCELFGTQVSKQTGLAASDHYGVVAELDF